MNNYEKELIAFRNAIIFCCRNIDGFKNEEEFIITLKLLLDKYGTAEYWLNKEKEVAENELGE